MADYQQVNVLGRISLEFGMNTHIHTHTHHGIWLIHHISFTITYKIDNWLLLWD